MRGKLTARESLAIAPIFDLIVGPESFYTNVAGAFDIPVVLFYSHSAPYNLGEFFKYHYPVIPNCDCHPCYQIIKDWRTNYKLNQREKSRKQENRCLLRDPNDVFKTIGFKCCVRIDHEKVINKIVEIME
jgi:ADP-heptose:LPS heptosyltransferase